MKVESGAINTLRLNIFVRIVYGLVPKNLAIFRAICIFLWWKLKKIKEKWKIKENCISALLQILFEEECCDFVYYSGCHCPCIPAPEFRIPYQRVDL